MLAELIDVPGLGIDGRVGKIANLHVIDHASNGWIQASLMRNHETNFLGLKSGDRIQVERSQPDPLLWRGIDSWSQNVSHQRRSR
jgi:hypothetical protein